MFGFLRRIFGPRERPLPPPRFTLDDLAARLGLSVAALRSVRVAYTTFTIAKRSGGTRTIDAPGPELKAVQRRIQRRILSGLRAHPAATGFERGHSIVTNALPHAGKDLVIRLDLQEFFPSISANRVEGYFRFIGYDPETAGLLTSLCTHEGRLPQGAPTSPRLSNLVNYRLDSRLAALAEARGFSYSRYADDLTLSLAENNAKAVRRQNLKTLEVWTQKAPRPNDIIRLAHRIVREEGYRLHTDKKLRLARRHDRQLVTGLVVNEKPNLPRRTRRRLRAVAHHLQTGRPATLTPAQLAGWQALQAMIAMQSAQRSARDSPDL